MSEEKKTSFDEINVGRMNVVDDDGTVRMCLSSTDRLPPPFEVDGEPAHRDGLPMAGITFYNDDGMESAGLGFGSEKDEDGNVYQQASLSFDPYKQNDAITFNMTDQNGIREMAVEMFDRPTIAITDLNRKIKEKEKNASKEELQAYLQELDDQGFSGRSRIRVAKNAEGEAEVKLADSKGNPRIRMVVDENDEPKMEFLDKNGDVSHRFP